MNATGTGKVCELRDRVAQLIGDNRFRTWFGDGTNLEIAGEEVFVNVTTRFIGDWIATNYMNQLAEASTDVMGGCPLVQIRLKGSPKAEPSPHSNGKITARPAPAATPARLKRTDRPVLRGELANFVVGPNNELAYSAARRAIKELSEAYRPLLIHGGVGLGKTHLLHGCFNAVQREHPLLNCVYVSGEEFTNEYVCALKARREDVFRARFRSVDILLVDDIHFLEGKKATQGEFLHTFNAIGAAGKAIIISSDRHPRLLATLGEPLANRLTAGTVVELLPPDYSTRCEILRRRAQAFKKELPADVIDYVARQIGGTVRDLEGAFHRLIAVAALSHTRLDLALAKQAVADLCGDQNQSPTVEKIEDTVAARFGINRAAVHSAARDRIVSGARSVAMYLVRKHLRLSLPQIGRSMGNKNHTTVLIASRRVEDQLVRDAEVAVKTAAGYQELSLRTLVHELEVELGLAS